MLLGAPAAPPPGRLVPPDQWSRCLRSSTTHPPLPKLHRTRSVPRSADKKKASASASYSLPCIKKKAKSAVARASPSPARRSPTLKLLPARLRVRGADSSDGRVKLKAKAWSTPPRNRRRSQICLDVAKTPSLQPAPSPAPSTTSTSPLAPLICSKRPPHIFSSPPSPLPTSPSSLRSPSHNQKTFSTASPAGHLPPGHLAAKGKSVNLLHPRLFDGHSEVEEGTLGLLILLCGLVRDISQQEKRQKKSRKRSVALPRITSSSLSFPQRAIIASPLAGRRIANGKNGRRSRLCNECLSKLYHASEGREVFRKKIAETYFHQNPGWLSLDTIGGRQQWKTISALLTQLVKSVPSSMENAWVA